jgi:predicted unusual protein kinase regulating ubiquinone biosynthesis (AarF/ABC1/UbiB family)
VQPHFDERGFRRDVADLVAQNMGATVGQMQIGRVVLMLARMSGERGIRVEPELTMLGKTLLNLDQVGCTLDPDFDPNASIRRNAAELMRQRVRKSLSPGNLFAGVMELKEFAENLPRRVNTILDRVASNSLEVKVDAIDEKMLLEVHQGRQPHHDGPHPGLAHRGGGPAHAGGDVVPILGYPGSDRLLLLRPRAGSPRPNILWADHKHRQRTARSAPGGSAG